MNTTMNAQVPFATPVAGARPAPFYRPVGREIEVFEHAFRNRLPLLLKGPTGAGKSRLVEAMAARLDLALYTVGCHEETSAVDLIGRYLIKGDDTVWQDGPVTRAVREGALVYIDEIAEARPDTIVALHSLTDHRRALFVERTGETLHAPDRFMLVASYNPGYQGIARELKASTKQRFVCLTFDYPAPALEKEIVTIESGVDASSAEKLVRLAGRIRNLAELGLPETASTRLLVSAGRLIAQGLPPRAACDSAVLQPLTDDPDTLRALRDLVALIF